MSKRVPCRGNKGYRLDSCGKRMFLQKAGPGTEKLKLGKGAVWAEALRKARVSFFHPSK